MAGFLLVLSGCTSIHEPSGFLHDYSRLTKGRHFRQEHIAAGVDFSKYQKVRVNAVELRYFNNPYEKFSEEELQRLAADLKTALETQLARKYEVLPEAKWPDAHTLVIGPALVYVDTPERLMNLATIWLIGLTFSRGSAALEAKLMDGASGKEIALAAERRKGGGGLTDIQCLLLGGWFRFVDAKGAFKRWGKDLVRMTHEQQP